MRRVRIEVMPWLSGYLVEGSTGPALLDEYVADGTRVRDLLQQLVGRKRDLEEVLFDSSKGSLAGHVVATLNGRILELAGGLETELKDGDTLRLMVGIVGG